MTPNQNTMQSPRTKMPDLIKMRARLFDLHVAGKRDTPEYQRLTEKVHAADVRGGESNDRN